MHRPVQRNQVVLYGCEEKKSKVEFNVSKNTKGIEPFD